MKIRFTQETIKTLFEKSYFIIPAYQRSYSWDEEQCEAFFYDLEEQVKSNNSYFFGNIVVEQKNNEDIKEIIDGQQRLTTILIFIRTIYEYIKDKDNLPIQNVTELFFEDKKRVKFHPMNMDYKYFYETIIKGKNINQKLKTISQKRLLNSRKYFIKKMKNKNMEEIIEMFNKIIFSNITLTTLMQKVESAFMFELQNNRGKRLTNMERLKAYLMYQVYLNSKNESEANNKVENLSIFYENIYTALNDITILDEDDILWYHCQSIHGYGVCEKNDTVETIKEYYLDNTHTKEKKVLWIYDFLFDLNESFNKIKSLMLITDKYIDRMHSLGMHSFIFPFIIRGYKTIKDKSNIILFHHLLEMLAFRKSIIKSKSKITDHLNETLLNFDGNVYKLYLEIKQKLNEKWHWGDDNLSEQLNSGLLYRYASEKGLIYLLKIYELELNPQNKKVLKMKKLSIEHIAPQTPPKNIRETGYELLSTNKDYKEKFKNNYLDCLGNLALITNSLNSKVSNKILSEKLKMYKDYYKNTNNFCQLNEINRFLVNNNLKWSYNEVQQRHDELIEFVLNEWSFKKNEKL